MKCRRASKKCREIRIEDTTIDFTRTFSYLGVLFNQDCLWNKAIANRKILFSKACMALRCFGRRLGTNPPEVMVTIYKAKCLSIATFGAGLWGYKNCIDLQTVENEFFRYLLAIPKSTSAYVIHAELGAHTTCYRCDKVASNTLA